MHLVSQCVCELLIPAGTCGTAKAEQAAAAQERDKGSVSGPGLLYDYLTNAVRMQQKWHPV